MDTGSIAFILICAALVFLMTPALAFFYGGLGRRKNVLNTMMMSLAPMALASILWVIFGFSFSFSGSNSWIGDFNHLFMNGVDMAKNSLFPANHIPDGLFSGFQMMFSIITVALITGSVVGRMRFTPILIFMTAWLILVYYPLAHMVWGGGFLAQIHAIDFAGGDVVHISSGVTGLVLALVLGKRRDYERLDYRPHNIPFVVLGAGLLWFGWFGFNAGSALAANGVAINAFMTTNTAAAAAMFSWMIVEKILIGKPSIVGACSGAVVGLVAITPGAGFVSLWSSLIIGLLVSPLSYFMISVVKKKLGYDDALDAFGCHGIGGMFGGIMTGIFATPALAPEKGYAGLIYGSGKLLLANVSAVVFTVIFTALVSWIIIKVIALFMPIRVSDRAEAIGLDDSEHEETAYPTFLGLDS
ncbi:ammonium transporter [Lactococcus lactis]|uniref:ammonium transporter n=1 Tax=Lactococcus lactis TaxID=1358 RepID=UPI0014561E42|nr:ammonium transporter [Lactococcus lactis]MCL9639997.1 ammonium transporter [Lactococcus lactis]MCT0439939.1 ammonium transporter [Lactococcus lactis subsp. lactis]MCT2921435.1 ammonium transporter [Lactococcus lactis]NLS46253.1 ammonium transporter [Lactococcus lactis]USI47360.1 ammonium transporter [Lactococcus lactis]